MVHNVLPDTEFLHDVGSVIMQMKSEVSPDAGVRIETASFLRCQCHYAVFGISNEVGGQLLYM